MGSAGVVAYTMNGKRLWGAGDYGIIDCYALNVAGSKEVYFYYYDDFDHVHLDEMREAGRYRVNGRYPLMGQFLLDKEGMIGQIDMSTLMRYRKNQHSYTAKHKLQLIDEDGKRIIGPVFMRGSHLYAYGKDGIYIKS